MKDSTSLRRSWGTVLVGAGLFMALSLTGCQVDSGGQTLPSPWYQKDDVQYFPPGPQFKLSREAAAMKAANPDQQPQAQPPRQ